MEPRPIAIPSKPSEVDIACDLVFGIRQLSSNVRCYCELKARLASQRRGSRFDLVVFEDDKPLVIIEIKKTRRANRNTKQLFKYRMFGLPVILCAGPLHIAKTIDKVRRLLHSTKQDIEILKSKINSSLKRIRV